MAYPTVSFPPSQPGSRLARESPAPARALGRLEQPGRCSRSLLRNGKEGGGCTLEARGRWIPACAGPLAPGTELGGHCPPLLFPMARWAPSWEQPRGVTLGVRGPSSGPCGSLGVAAGCEPPPALPSPCSQLPRGSPPAPAPAPRVINGPWELIPGQLGLLEPPCHLGRAALFHRVIYRDGSLPPHPARDRRTRLALQGAQPCPMRSPWDQHCTGCWALPIHLLGMKESPGPALSCLALGNDLLQSREDPGRLQGPRTPPRAERGAVVSPHAHQTPRLARSCPPLYTLPTRPQMGPTPINPEASQLPAPQGGGAEPPGREAGR